MRRYAALSNCNIAGEGTETTVVDLSGTECREKRELAQFVVEALAARLIHQYGELTNGADPVAVVAAAPAVARAMLDDRPLPDDPASVGAASLIRAHIGTMEGLAA